MAAWAPCASAGGTVGGQTFSSPGVETAGKRGISPSVMRVSFREGDDLAG